ncbi:MAG: hypothetical protein IT223_11605 [Crocinitomicaceae bacterium]|nr:hypothetical protein [Crocinitomicaceae bacterium]
MPYTKSILLSLLTVSATIYIHAQIQVDQSIQLTGGLGASAISGITDAPVLGTDAANKDYVDAAVAAGGGSSPTMLSDESATTMTIGSAMYYCRDLVESTYSDWHLPNYEELTYVLSMYGPFSSPASTNYIWFRDPIDYGNSTWARWSLKISDGATGAQYWNGTSVTYVRCVR